MSQSDFGNLESPLSGADFINNKLEPWRNALHSMHSGNSRPSYAVAGLMWLDTTTTPWIVKIFDGTDDITIGTVNASTNVFVPAGVVGDWVGSAGGTANALTFTPTIARTSYATGDVIEGLITATNTSETVTINVSGLGTKSSKASIGVGKVNIPIGAQQSGMIGRWVYDGTDFILLNVRANNPATAVASASTLNLDTATGDYVEVSGTTTVTAVTLANGQERTCRASGAFTLTHGASLILPTAANITTVAGDVFVLRGEPSGVVRMVNFMRASGAPLTGGSYYAIKTFTASGTYTPDAKMKNCRVTVQGAGGDVPSTSTNPSAQTSGGDGGKAIKAYTAADIGASVAFTITSGTVSFKSMTANKGSDGGVLATSSNRYRAGGAGGTASGGDINITGKTGAAASFCTTVYSAGLFSVDSGLGTSINPVAGVVPGEGATGSVQMTAGSMTAASGGIAMLVVEEFG